MRWRWASTCDSRLCPVIVGAGKDWTLEAWIKAKPAFPDKTPQLIDLDPHLAGFLFNGPGSQGVSVYRALTKRWSQERATPTA